MTMQSYNYRTFALSEVPSPDTFPGPEVGERMLDFAATTLDGTPVRLSDFAGRPLVLETGSLTCPIYTDTVREMNALPDRFPDVTFLLLYTHEAHPGERIGPHRTADEKRRNAELNRRVNGERRQVLVDDIEGTAHRLYGGFPNMLYLIGPDGTVLLRGHWSDPRGLEEALERLQRLQPLTDVRLRFRYPRPWIALRTLLRAGWKSLWDGTIAIPGFFAWHRRERRRGWG